jgi:hypothetical protein
MNYLILLFALVISVFAFWFSIKFIRMYLRVKKWDRIIASVTHKELVIHPRYSTTRTPYGLKVNYSYTVNHTDYTGHYVYLVELAGGQVNHMKSDGERRLNKIEKTMSVYVNPNDPAQSVMYCNKIGLYIFVFCMGIFSLLIGLVNIL